MTSELDISTDGRLGRIALNRPQAINALSLGMIEGIFAQLTAWQDDPAIAAILFEGNGEKGFCAGGDVRAARALVVGGTPEQADGYFTAEYRMNALIAGYPKPLIALTHGIVMGGGIGIAGHCAFRITQPGARFAMPESAIGFFGDVGVNAILAKAPLNRALLFLMSGISVGPADALSLGLADAVVAPERLAQLRADLVGAAGSSRPADAIVRLMQAESIVADEPSFTALCDSFALFAPESPAVVLRAVADIPELSELSQLLAKRSPTSLAATFYSQLEARKLMQVEATLAMDLRLAKLLSRLPDFAEGVRAVLVDKDQKPTWSPASLEALDTAPILAAVRGTGISTS